jgi:hypothetical protein
MRLEPLYRITFEYGESYRAGDEWLLIGEGRCQGRISGRYRCVNRPRARPNGTFVPDMDAAIETDDGATVLLRLTGRGEPDLEPTGRVVVALRHVADDARYAWLDGAVCAASGEVRDREIVVDVAEIIWEPLADTIPS